MRANQHPYLLMPTDGAQQHRAYPHQYRQVYHSISRHSTASSAMPQQHTYRQGTEMLSNVKCFIRKRNLRKIDIINTHFLVIYDRVGLMKLFRHVCVYCFNSCDGAGKMRSVFRTTQFHSMGNNLQTRRKSIFGTLEKKSYVPNFFFI